MKYSDRELNLSELLSLWPKVKRCFCRWFQSKHSMYLISNNFMGWPVHFYQICDRQIWTACTSEWVTSRSRDFETKLYKSLSTRVIPDNIYLFKVYNWNNRKRCEICSKLTIKTPEQCQWRRSSVFIVNFEHILHLFLIFPLLTLNK